MGGGQKKSKRQLDGNPTARQRLRESCVFFLDENLSRCEPILNVLRDAQLLFELHHLHFHSGEDDHVWLDTIGQRGWIVLTKDKGQRHAPLERSQIENHRIRQFAFSSGHISGLEMAEILKTNIRRILKFIEREQPPFIASVNRSGVHRRFP